MIEFDLKRELAVILAGRALYFSDLAAKLGVAPNTLSCWLNKRHSPPADFLERLEAALELRAGSLVQSAVQDADAIRKGGNA